MALEQKETMISTCSVESIKRSRRRLGNVDSRHEIHPQRS